MEHSRRAIVARGDDARSVGTDGEIENRFRVPASLAHAGGRAGVPETDDAVDGGGVDISPNFDGFDEALVDNEQVALGYMIDDLVKGIS